MRIIHEYGAVVATLAGNSRKIISLFASFILFPKPMMWHYIVGTVLFILGVAVNSYADSAERAAREREKDAASGVSSAGLSVVVAASSGESVGGLSGTSSPTKGLDLESVDLPVLKGEKETA